MKRIAAYLSVAMFALAAPFGLQALPLEKEPEVRVQIMNSLPGAELIPMAVYAGTAGETKFSFSPGEPLSIKAEEKQVVVRGANGEILLVGNLVTLVPSEAGAAMQFDKIPYGVGWWWEGSEVRSYNGTIELRVTTDDKLDVVVKLPMEEYLLGVVPSEIGSGTPLEAMKAQAVAARSEAVVALLEKKYAGPHFDICADVNCQAFSGNLKRSELSDQSVRETRGLVLFHGEKVIGAYYASNCGGHSESVENVWPERSGPQPYWSARFDGIDAEAAGPNLTTEAGLAEWVGSTPDTWCNPAKSKGLPDWCTKHFRWTRSYTGEKVTEFVSKKSDKDIGRVIGFKGLEFGPSGRMSKAVFIGEKGEYTVGPELAIRRVFSPPLPSSAVTLTLEGPADAPTNFVFNGAGYGHGVGMCQVGAIARAIGGQDFKTILTHYYRETEVSSAWKD